MSGNYIAAELRLIEQHISLLRDAIDDGDTTSCVYEFPNLTKLDIGVEPKEILLNKVTGDRAKALALLHLSDFRVTKDEPGLFGRRLAGTVLIQSNRHKDIEDRITVINQLKMAFQQSILQLHKNQDRRFEIFRDALPSVSKKAATRQILLAPANTTKIQFSWTHRYSGKTFTRIELEKRITQAGVRISEQVDALTGENRQQIELTKLANANHTDVFVQRRPIRVTPTAHIYTDAKTSGRNIIAHSPIFIINQTPHIGLFHNYPNRMRNNPKQELMPVIERLHIYCEKP